MAAAAPSLRARALRLLALREHSRAELARKLARHALPPRDAAAAETPDDGAAAEEQAAEAARRVEALLDELAASGLLDERRAADAVVRSQAGRFGRMRLQQDLRRRGLPPELAAQALATVEGSELARAHEVWRRRFGQPSADPAERARQARFLAGRGFDADVIRRVVRGLAEEV